MDSSYVSGDTYSNSCPASTHVSCIVLLSIHDLTQTLRNAPLYNSLDQGIFRGMDTLHKRAYELSSEHIKTINALADKYGRYADSSPDFENPPVHIIVGN